MQSVDNPADVTNLIKTGINYFKLGNVKPQLTMQKLRTTVASTNPVADVMNNTVHATIVIELTHFTVTLSGAQPIEIAAAVANESMVDELTFKINTVEIKQKV
jgi:ABC-type dipeptide/oligopeptide/nickel transport system permease component